MSKFSFRWIYEACYEMILPGGEHVVIDPDISIHKFPEFSAEDFERVDYMICTHTHFDHTSDIGYLSDKFQPKLMVGDMGIMELARFFNLSFANLYPVTNGEVWDFGNVKFQFYRGKHTGIISPDRGRPKASLQTTIRNFGIEGHGFCDQYGWLESYNTLISCSNNIRIMMVSGIAANQEIYRIAENFRPNILIRQMAFDTPEDYARECVKFGASIIVPHHHEKITGRWNLSQDEIQKRVQAELDKHLPDSSFCFPEQYQWYEIHMGMEKK